MNKNFELFLYLGAAISAVGSMVQLAIPSQFIGTLISMFGLLMMVVSAEVIL